MEQTKDLKNKKLVRRLIQLSQPKKDISKTFQNKELQDIIDDLRGIEVTTEEVDELGLDEVIQELEDWIDGK